METQVNTEIPIVVTDFYNNIADLVKDGNFNQVKKELNSSFNKITEQVPQEVREKTEEFRDVVNKYFQIPTYGKGERDGHYYISSWHIKNIADSITPQTPEEDNTVSKLKSVAAFCNTPR